MCTHLQPPPVSSIQLHSPPPRSFQLPDSSIQLHPAHFSLHPALCNTLINIRTKIPNLIGQFPQFRTKNSKLIILTQNLYTWYLGGADPDKKFQKNSFLGKFGPKKSKLFVLPENWRKWYIEDADSYSDISFLNFQP